MKYELKKAIHVIGKDGSVAQSITELNFREEVVAGDFRGIQMNDPMLWDDLLKLAGRLSGQPDLVINKMTFKDLTEVAKLVGGFLQGGQET